MSHRSAAHYRHSSPPGPARHPSAAAAVVARPALRTDFTFVHAGRQLRIGPIAFWIVVGTLVIMAGWTIVTASYFAFHDDVLTRLLTRQARMQSAYEDRIAEMREQVDRVTSRQLLDQEQFEHKLDHVLHRQAVLESRAEMLGSVLGPGVTGSIARRGQSASGDDQSSRARSLPTDDTAHSLAPVGGRLRLQSRLSPPDGQRLGARAVASGIEGTLARLRTSLNRVAVTQTALLNATQRRYDARARRIKSVLTDIGVDVSKIHPAPAADTGGPFIPVKPDAANAFERQVYRVSVVKAEVQSLRHTVTLVPLRKPLTGPLQVTSGFGIRTDPFLHVPAMHPGLDLRAAVGDPVHATGSGIVKIAGWYGGYGRMVEIKHADGFATRYGHLSKLFVHVGEKVTVGQIIGKTGSTGRSTGPHLHYETRVDGEAVNPEKFLRAGVRLDTVLNGAGAS